MKAEGQSQHSSEEGSSSGAQSLRRTHLNVRGKKRRYDTCCREARKLPVLDMPCWLSVCYSKYGFRWPSERYKTAFLRVAHEDIPPLCSFIIGDEAFKRIDGRYGGFLFEEICREICIRRKHLFLRFILDNSVPNTAKLTLGEMLRKSVSFPQYRHYLRAVFNFLFPIELLGKQNMATVVDSAAKNIFNLCRYERIHFKNFFSPKLKSSKVKWLTGFDDQLDRTAAFRRTVVWLLWFAIDVTRATFYVTERSCSNRLLFYRKNVWRKIEEHCFVQLKWRKGLREVEASADVQNEFCSRLRFIPKTCSARPLMASLGSAGTGCENDLVSKLNGLLSLICKTSHQRSKNCQMLPLTGAGIRGSHDSFVFRFRKFARNHWGKHVYSVKTDIKECFDRVNHNKLREILQRFLHPKKYYRFKIRLNKTRGSERGREEEKKKGTGRKRKKLASLSNSWTAVPQRNRFVRLFEKFNATSSVQMQKVIMSGAEALDIIEKTIIQRKIVFRNKKYVSYRGIPQGMSLSSRLCDIYLGAMELQHFGEFLRRRDTLLFRYVDDYVLLTLDKDVAEQFLSRILYGIGDDYDMVADETKTVVNFVPVSSQVTQLTTVLKNDKDFFTWCGYEIFPQHFSISVDGKKLDHRNSFFPPVAEMSGSRVKRTAILKYTKEGLRKRFNVLSGVIPSEWKIKAIRKLARLGFSVYARPFARKIRLSPKGSWNKLFMRRLEAWIRQGFSYRYGRRAASVFEL